MTEKKQRTPWDPDDYLTYGLLGIVVGSFVLGATYEDAPFIGFIVLGIAGLFLQIGIIAKGVEVGNKSSFADEG